MFTDYDFLQLQSMEEIESLYNKLSNDLLTNNRFYFHFDHDQLHTYLKDPLTSVKTCFNRFKYNWENFNNHKQLLYHFLKHHHVTYPEPFKFKSRICIQEITINYQDILNEINILRINNGEISYSYKQLILKLVKSIIINKVLNKLQELVTCEVDLFSNKIQIEYYDVDREAHYNKEYKLTKFLLKYQTIYPDEYKQLSAWLIVSSDWKDIFLSSTFKQWVSCMNLINTYKDHKIKYSNENYVKSGGLVAYLVLNLNDGKTIDEIMDDVGINRIVLSTLYLEMPY